MTSTTPDIFDVIHTRRSIRDYQDRPVPRESMERIIEAGRYAPSGRNRQAAHFLVLEDAAAINRITQELKVAIGKQPGSYYSAVVGAPGYTVNFNAPVFVVLSVDPERSLTPEADAAVALENMFLAARALGLGSCWINQLKAANGDPDFNALLESLGRPAGYKVYGSAAFGFPQKGFPEAAARKSLVTWG